MVSASVSPSRSNDRRWGEALIMKDNACITPFQEELENALRGCTLNPLHVDVVNESTWYHLRHRLGPRRHGYIQVKYNDSNLKYEGFIFDLKRREEDLEIVPKKVLVSSATTKWQAFKQAEQAMRDRDKNKPMLPDENTMGRSIQTIDRIKLIANTHFRITVVSEQFQRIPPAERLEMTWRELLNSPLGRSTEFQTTDMSLSVPTQLKLSSTFGARVLSLNLLKVVTNGDPKGTLMLITAITPSQWKPDKYKPLPSERLGKSHLDMKRLHVDTSASPIKQRGRVRKLTTATDATVENIKSPSRSSNEQNPSDALMSESLGLDATVSGVQYDQLGGIYGHFFSDLSNDVREMVLHRYKDNKELIRIADKQPSSQEQRELKKSLIVSRKPDQPDFKPRTNLSRLREKLNVGGSKGAEDVGTHSLDEMREEVLISARRMELAAQRMQRMRRINLLTRARRRLWRREYAAVFIQRVLRGHFGRRYTLMYAKLKPLAALRIQKLYRDVKRQCILKMWNFLTYRLTRVVLVRIKTFIKNCFLSYLRKRHAKATVIQKICRGRIARVMVFKLLGRRTFLLDLFQHGAIQMQRIVRGFISRRYYFRVHLPQKLFFIIVIPAVIRLQRIFRGRAAVRYAAVLRYESRCLLLIQRNVRAFVRRCWNAQRRQAQREKRASTMIQRQYRRHYDRKIYKLKYYFHWYVNIFLPAVVRVQASIRCFHARKRVRIQRLRATAARVVQRAYRAFVRYRKGQEIIRKIIEARRNQYVVRVQAQIRRFLCYHKYKRALRSQHGRQLFAAKIILRAWRSYKINQKYQILLEDHRKQAQDLLLNKFLKLRKAIKLDLKELRSDIAAVDKTIERYRARCKELETYNAQAQFRLSKIKTEMDGLSYDDYERGWAEALGQEFEFISHQLLMANEEYRLVKHKVMNSEKERIELLLELEENEMEYDEVDSSSNEMLEKSRMVQLQRAEYKANDYINKLRYRERVHWKIDSNRSKKMRNLRHNYQDIVKKTQSTRPLEYYTTVNYEKKKKRVDFEEFAQIRHLEQEASECDQNSRPKSYESYAAPMEKTFDVIVKSSLEQLRGVTLDDRAVRFRIQEQMNSVAQKKNNRGQFAALKEDFR